MKRNIPLLLAILATSLSSYSQTTQPEKIILRDTVYVDDPKNPGSMLMKIEETVKYIANLGNYPHGSKITESEFKSSPGLVPVAKDVAITTYEMEFNSSKNNRLMKRQSNVFGPEIDGELMITGSDGIVTFKAIKGKLNGKEVEFQDIKITLK